MTRPIRAADVQVAKIFQARCHLPDCTAGMGGGPWSGELLADWQEANRDREAHLTWHRQELTRQRLAGTDEPGALPFT